MAEYARTYGGPPAPELKWPLFTALCERAARFDARETLGTADAVMLALGMSFGESREAKREQDRLLRRAYPLKRSGPKEITNRFAEDAESASSQADAGGGE